MEHIKFPSIEQFRTIVKHVRDTCNYHTIPLPKLKFRGTVKLHGTNASVVMTPDEIWAQSREHIITPIKDNAGFAQYVHTRENMFREMEKAIRTFAGLTPEDTITVYGEWCGAGIQKGVGISALQKMFVVFGIRVGTGDSTRWLSRMVHNETFNACVGMLTPERVFSIFDFKTWEVEIDFANPEAIQNLLGEITLGVEEECPVALAFGVAPMQTLIATQKSDGEITIDDPSVVGQLYTTVESKLKPIFKKLREDGRTGNILIKLNLD